MGKTDDLDAFIAARTAMNPDFPAMVQAELETRRLVLELAAERERQGLSQERVAVALGTKQPNVARLERGGVDPKHSSLVRYAGLLGKRIALEPLTPRGGEGSDRNSESAARKPRADGRPVPSETRSA